MDSARSEYSDMGSTLGSSRLGDGSSFVSFADSSSVSSSRASTARSDLISSMEHKLLARRAEKKKKREREHRRQVATANQLTADEQRRADRDAERVRRHQEMTQWLPTPETLRRRHVEHQQRAKQSLRTVLTWYPPTHSTVLVTATNEVAPLFSRDAQQHAQREASQRALAAQANQEAAALHRRVAELQRKMDCVRHLNQPRESQGTITVSMAKAKAKKHHATHTRRTHSVAPLLGASASAPSFFFRDPPAVAALAEAHEAMEVDAFLAAHKRQRRRALAATTIQAMWRMARQRRRFLTWRRGQRWRHVAACFELWSLAFKLTRHARWALQRRHLRAWRTHVVSVLSLRRLELRLFREAESLPELPKLVANLVLTADGDDDDAYARKVLARPTKASYVNAAFLSVETTVVTELAPRRLQAQHLEARRALAKKVVQRAFKLWQQAHIATKRTQMNAQLCLKRAVRLAVHSQRPAWRGEKLLLVFEVWARWASFHRARRLGVPPPATFAPLPHWDLWLHNHQERMVRRVKAGARAPLATMRRFVHRFRVLADIAHRKREANALATRHFATGCCRAVLLAWREVIAESAATKKLLRGVLSSWRAYAARTKWLRPRRRQVVAMREHREHARVWTAWRKVQLRCCFRRELYRARLASQPRWRWQVRRLLSLWLSQQSPLVMAKTFEAWRRLARRRALWRTLQLHSKSLRRRHLMGSVFGSWKAVVWKQEEEFLEDRLRLSAWDVRRELAPLLPMLFYGTYADAALLFGGVAPDASESVTEQAETQGSTTTGSSSNDSGDEVVAWRQRELRAFHVALTQGGVTETRNVILKSKHLLNQVDDTTGNAALHVAAQLLDPVRRREVTVLLLSEGASTQRRVNRHGLTPSQLVEVDDEETRELLRDGVYDFYKRRALQSKGSTARDGDTVDGNDDDDGSGRLVWALVTLLASELVTGQRLPACEHEQLEWHSDLKEERWLRRGRVVFDSGSEFAPVAGRCRALLYGVQRRLWKTPHEMWVAEWQRYRGQHQHQRQPQQGGVSSRLRLRHRRTRRMMEEEKMDLLSWLRVRVEEDPMLASRRGADCEEQDNGELGDDGAYAALLRSRSGDDTEAEQWLVRSFVGVLFSLGVTMEAAWREADRLQELCDVLESDLLRRYQAIMRAELWAPPLARFFSDTTDVELFFQHERLRVEVTLRRRRHHDERDDKEERKALERLRLEAAAVLAKTQRKLRKVDKKLEVARLHMAVLEDQQARLLLKRGEALLALTENVAPLGDARLQLEIARLRVARLRLKQNAWTTECRALTDMKRELDAEVNDQEAAASSSKMEGEEDGDEEDISALEAKRAFLESQQAAHVAAIRSGIASASTGSGEPARTELRRLHRAATAALSSLIVANLLRRCCWFLVENLAKEEVEDTYESSVDVEGEDVVDSGDDANNGAEGLAPPTARLSRRVSNAAANTFAAVRKASVLEAGSPSRRRSSIVYARAVMDTVQRSTASTDDTERLDVLMRDTYNGSAQLLFTSDRGALADEDALRWKMEKEERRRQRRQYGSVAEAERNPITGERETASSRLVDTVELEQRAANEVTRAATKTPQQRVRNRKRELLRQVMVQRQLARLAGRGPEADRVVPDGDDEVVVEEDGGEGSESTRHRVDAVVCADVDLGFGNFVAGEQGVSESQPVAVAAGTDTSSLTDALASIAAESLWKRGGGVRQSGESGKPSADLFASAEDEQVFNASFRVLSATKERRTTSNGGSRRLSAIGTLTSRVEVERTAVTPDPTTVGAMDSVDTIHGDVEGERGDQDWSTVFLNGETSDEGYDGSERAGFDRLPQVSVAEEDGEDEEDGTASTAETQPTTPSVLVELSAVVSPTEEVEFFDQILQHYLDRVRRDSFVATTLLPVDTLAEEQVNESPVDTTEVADQQVVGGEERTDAIDERVKTPLIKWEPSLAMASEASQPSGSPLVFDTTKLMAPRVHVTVVRAPQRHMSSSGVLPSTPEPRTEHIHSTSSELLLSGKSVPLRDGRRRSSVQPPQRRKPSSVLSASTTSQEPLSESVSELQSIQLTQEEPTTAGNEGETSADVVDALASPTIPKVSVMIQRKSSPPEDTTPTSALPTSEPERLANGEPAPSPTRKQSTVRPLPLAVCELSVVTTKAEDTPTADPPRRRPSQWDRPNASIDTKRKLNLRRATVAAASVDLSLAGIRATPAVKPEQTTAVDFQVTADAAITLTQSQRRDVWREFTSLPLTEGMQDAYAQVHPHLYDVVTPAPEPTPTDTMSISTTASTPVAQLPLDKQLAIDKKFWSAVEGYKAVGGGGLLPLDDKTRKLRLQDRAVSIYQQFLCPNAPTRVAWIHMYEEELRTVQQRLLFAPRSLFDTLQQSAQLHISTLRSKLRANQI